MTGTEDTRPTHTVRETCFLPLGLRPTRPKDRPVKGQTQWGVGRARLGGTTVGTPGFLQGPVLHLKCRPHSLQLSSFRPDASAPFGVHPHPPLARSQPLLLPLDFGQLLFPLLSVQ